MTGWNQKNAIGKKLSDVLKFKDKHISFIEQDLVNKVLMEGTVLNLLEDHILITKYGTEIPLSINIAPLKEGNTPGIVLVFRDNSERKQFEETIRYQAYHDILTDLPNRMLFIDHFTLELAQARRNSKKLGILFIDLDWYITNLRWT
ncbi:MAG: diguanylate cyclase [Candidatus Firestonebacteria bacterium]|nr:diguanylate cyclase [Candidatus Firestonebacteria bacterium]